MKRIFPVFLAVIILLSSAPLEGLVGIDIKDVFGVRSAAAYNVGDRIQYGTYPQSRVVDEALIAKLNTTDTPWISYKYYSGTGEYDGGHMTSSDYMEYRDAYACGKKYRAVRFTGYRPFWTYCTQDASSSNQDQNGYYVGTTYWFRFDPIVWRILDPSDGLILAETCLDAQPYNNFFIYKFEGPLGEGYYGDQDSTYWASNYYYSSIRKWLNEDFYNTAFSDEQKSNIKTSHIINESATSSKYDATDSDDKIFLLSFGDSINPLYGFSSYYRDEDDSKRAKGTEYAKAQGMYESQYGTCWWWLRSPCSSVNVSYIYYNGDCYNGYPNVSGTEGGIRPACKVRNIKSDISQYIDVSASDHTPASAVKENVINATCKSVGSYDEVVFCSVCGAELSRVAKTIAKTSHKAEVVPAVAATCVKTGLTEGSKCSVCGAVITAQKTVPAKEHSYDSGKVTKAATYTSTGEKLFTCTVCKATKTEKIAKLKAPTVAKVSGLKASKVKTNAITLKWSKAKNADTYKVYRSTDGKKWTKITTTTKLTYTDKSVKAGTKYQYRVKGNHSASGENGEYSSVLKTGTITAAPKISKLTSTKTKTATVTWKKVTGAKSYVVYTSKDGKKFTKATTTTKTTATVKKLEAGKKVYVKVIAVNAYGKNSAYSAVKSVKVKK